MIATMSGELDNFNESISTCSFASRVASIKNKAQINEEVDPRLVIRRLKQQVQVQIDRDRARDREIEGERACDHSYS